MIVIKDDVLDIDTLALIQENYFCNKPIYSTNWIDKHNIPPYFNILLSHAKKYYDINSYVGVEWWTQKDGSLPSKGWHYDLDENYWKSANKIKTPLCSIIFYPLIENLQGGQFKTESAIITPKTNRLIIMSPKVLHNVENYTGTRWSMLINPWDYNLL